MTTPKLKIAMLAAHSCPVGELGAKDTGGMSVYIREVARELSKQGHSVDVYTRVHDPSDPIMEGLGAGARLIHVKAGQPAKINKLEVYSYLPEFTRNLEAFRDRSGLTYDLIFSHYWMSGLVGEELQKLWHVPHVIMFHTMGLVKNAIGVGEGDPPLRIDAEKKLVRSCQRIIAATDKGQAELERFYGVAADKISIVPCGVNMEMFRPVDRSAARQKLGLGDEKVIVFVGRLDPLKGVERLVEALPRLDNIPGLRLIVIGGDEGSRGEVARLRRLSTDLGVQDKIDFRGTVPQEVLPYFYGATDACVVPSYYESFGLVALEALSCGTPVVASDVGDLEKIILPGKTGCVVRDNTPRALAGGIAHVLQWPARDMETLRRIRASVGRYSWAGVAGEIAAALDNVHEEWLTPVLS